MVKGGMGGAVGTAIVRGAHHIAPDHSSGYRPRGPRVRHPDKRTARADDRHFSSLRGVAEKRDRHGLSFVLFARVGSSLCGQSELQVVALLRTARSVIKLGPLVAAADDRSGSVVGVHD